jgi:hypothetical protein
VSRRELQIGRISVRIDNQLPLTKREFYRLAGLADAALCRDEISPDDYDFLTNNEAAARSWMWGRPWARLRRLMGANRVHA